ncbi:MAG: hypothetical protein Q9160_009218 [Pyrenula sp. 1 TL-2023]
MSQKLIDAVDVPIADIIIGWARQNIARIIRAYSGWEGWAQVEIATALYNDRYAPNADARDAMLAITTTVSREVAIYPPTPTAKGGVSQKRADIVVEFGAPSRREFIVIELKCEGFYNKEAFVQAVKEDTVKVNGDIEHSYKPARAWVLGFSTSQEVYDEMVRQRPKANVIKLYPALQGGPRLSPDELNTVQKVKPVIALWIFEKELLMR